MVDDCISGVRGHVEKEEIFGEIVNNRQKFFAIPIHEVSAEFLPEYLGNLIVDQGFCRKGR